MLNSSIPQPRTQRKEITALRNHLSNLEAIARHGRLAEDPTEVRAAVWTFARPSAVLARLAARDRRFA